MADELIKVAEDSARGGFFLISGTAISTVILALGAILVGRFLGPEFYGQYTLALVVPQLLFMFTDLGINQGIMKFTASLRLKGETDRLQKIIKYGLLLKAFTGIGIFFINYAFADTFASFIIQRPDLGFYVRIASTGVLFQVILSTSTSAFIGLDKTEYNALTGNIQAIAKAIISIVLVLLGFSVAGAIVGYVASYIVAAVVGMFFLFFLIRDRPSIKSNHSISDDLKILMLYGAPLYISLLLTGFIPIYQSIMLATFATDVDIGNYNAASNFLALMAVLSVPITTALLPAFSKLNSAANQKTKTFFKLANKYTAIIIIPMTFLLIIFSKEIVKVVYGSGYQSAPVFLATFCLLYFLVGLGYLTLSSFYNGLGETKTTLKISMLAFVILIVLSPIMTKTYSVLGSITAYLAAATASTVYGSYIARRKFQMEFDVRSITKIYFISAVSSVPSVLLLYLTSIPILFNVIMGVVLYLFIYSTLAPLTKIVNTSELQTITHITQKIRLLAFVVKPILEYQQKLLHMQQTSRNSRKIRIT